MATTAVVSVLETTAPSNSAGTQSMPIVARATAAMASVLATTSPMASDEMGRMFATKSRQEVKNSAA
jgi:hypothetical protein